VRDRIARRLGIHLDSSDLGCPLMT